MNVLKRESKIRAKRSRYGKFQSHELLLFRSNCHVYASVLSLFDMKVKTSISTLSIKDRNKEQSMSRTERANWVGKSIAEKCKLLGINPVVNTAGYRFHGVIRSLVDSFKSEMSRVVN